MVAAQLGFQWGALSTLSDFNSYGCWCGIGGGGPVKDQIDDCCRIHDLCYDSVLENCSLLDNLYLGAYKYEANEESIESKIDQEDCNIRSCQCDKAAAYCFKKYLSHYNRDNKNYNKEKCGREDEDTCLPQGMKTVLIKSPLLCSSGAIANALRDGCNMCQKVTYSDKPGYVTNCQICTTCKTCPDGYKCPCEGTFKPQICPAGTMQNKMRDNCNKCEPGTYSDQPGYWANCLEICKTCKRCSDGHICPGEGNTSLKAKCEAGAIANFARTACDPCVPSTLAF